MKPQTLQTIIVRNPPLRTGVCTRRPSYESPNIHILLVSLCKTCRRSFQFVRELSSSIGKSTLKKLKEQKRIIVLVCYKELQI